MGAGMNVSEKIVVAIPTYNERENVEKLYSEIKSLNLPIDFYFIDDDSPDGTGHLLAEIARRDSSVRVLHRSRKMGLGTAHIEAFRFARQQGYGYLMTMDADFTHHPHFIPHITARKDSDIVIGSRYVGGAAMTGWGKIRLPFTLFWRWMIARGLGMPYDCTGAFRMYRVDKLDPAVFERLSSRGFSFCMESIYYFKKAGLVINEVPIKAHIRLHGKSKLSMSIMREAAGMFLKLFFDRLRRPTKRAVS
jgi:dolichol-phosphate mannosyltransferase